MNFEVMMVTYNGADHEYFKEATRSVHTAIKKLYDNHFTGNIIFTIGVDGLINEELEMQLRQEKHNGCNIVYFSENRGLGLVLRDLVSRSTADFIVRMDDDDVMEVNRLAKIVPLHEAGIDLISSNIAEFSNLKNGYDQVRKVSSKFGSAFDYFRNPLNHVATSFAREKILAAGNYRDVKYFEDWDLWLRSTNLTFMKVEDITVFVRLDTNAIRRRRGFKFLRYEFNFLVQMIKDGNVKVLIFAIALMIRMPLKLLPATILAGVYSKFLRRSTSG